MYIYQNILVGGVVSCADWVLPGDFSPFEMEMVQTQENQAKFGEDFIRRSLTFARLC